MASNLEIPDMPPLTDDMHADLRLLERKLKSALGDCYRGHDLHDSHAAFEYVRTYATKFYDLFYGFYSKYLDYESHWRSQSERFASGRVAKCISSYSDIEYFFDRDPTLILRVKKTIEEHAGRTAPRKLVRMADVPPAPRMSNAGSLPGVSEKPRILTSPPSPYSLAAAVGDRKAAAYAKSGIEMNCGSC
jgi:hypothetical protein